MNCIIDRRVSDFLETRSFVMLRRTCKTHYEDQEAWSLKVTMATIQFDTLNTKETLGLNYLMNWALKLFQNTGSTEWFQEVVNWLEYKISIQIMHTFLLNTNPMSMYSLNVSKLSLRRKLLWSKLFYLNENVYKKHKRKYEEYEFKDVAPRPAKKSRILCY